MRSSPFGRRLERGIRTGRPPGLQCEADSLVHCLAVSSALVPLLLPSSSAPHTSIHISAKVRWYSTAHRIPTTVTAAAGYSSFLPLHRLVAMSGMVLKQLPSAVTSAGVQEVSQGAGQMESLQRQRGVRACAVEHLCLHSAVAVSPSSFAVLCSAACACLYALSTALAIAGADFALVCGDTRMSDGYTILSRTQPKIFQLSAQPPPLPCTAQSPAAQGAQRSSLELRQLHCSRHPQCNAAPSLVLSRHPCFLPCVSFCCV